MKVGDTVYIVDANFRGARQETVTKIGRKYFTAGGHEYSIETGAWKDKDWGYQRSAYTEERWARREREHAFRKALTEFHDLVFRRHKLAEISDAELDQMAARLGELSVQMMTTRADHWDNFKKSVES